MTEGARQQGRGVGGISRRATSWTAWVLWMLILGFYVISFDSGIGSSWYVLADPRLWSV